MFRIAASCRRGVTLRVLGSLVGGANGWAGHIHTNRGRRITVPHLGERMDPMRQLTRDDNVQEVPTQRYSESEPITTSVVPRVIGVAAGGVATVIGLIAVARVDWSNNGIHAPAVSVVSIPFKPVVALVTLGVGVIALIVGASRDRVSKLVLGVLLIAVGLAIHFGHTNAVKWYLGNRIAWLSGLVGAALVVSGLLLQPRRVVRTYDTADA